MESLVQGFGQTHFNHRQATSLSSGQELTQLAVSLLNHTRKLVNGWHTVWIQEQNFGVQWVMKNPLTTMATTLVVFHVHNLLMAIYTTADSAERFIAMTQKLEI